MAFPGFLPLKTPTTGYIGFYLSPCYMRALKNWFLRIYFLYNAKLELNFCETKIISVHAGHNHFPGAYLLTVARHEFVSLIEIFQSGITGNFSIGTNALVTQQQVFALILV